MFCQRPPCVFPSARTALTERPPRSPSLQIDETVETQVRRPDPFPHVYRTGRCTSTLRIPGTSRLVLDLRLQGLPETGRKRKSAIKRRRSLTVAKLMPASAGILDSGMTFKWIVYFRTICPDSPQISSSMLMSSITYRIENSQHASPH